jgi:DNA helicase II / ATP-dependent DNA helicase PcrA
VETAQDEAEEDGEELSLALTPSEPGAAPKKRASKAKEPAIPSPPRVWSAQQTDIFAEVTSSTYHLAIEALAGTGKTTTLVEIVEKHLPPEARVLVLAFGREISAELKRRLPGAQVATIHGLGHKALFGRFGVGKPRLDKLDETLRGEEFFPLVKDQRAQRSAVKRLVSMAKATLAHTPEEALALCSRVSPKVDPLALDLDAASDKSPGGEARRQRAIKALGDRVIEAMNVAVETAQDGWDHDDMLFVPYALGMNLGEYDYVLVDEAQDLSRVQIELIFRCLAPGGRVLAVGDPRQAIYAFRGADPQAWKLLLSRLGARALPLATTYRCGRAIVKLANKEVPTLRAHEANGDGKVTRVDGVDVAQLEPGDFVISRSNAPLVNLCLRALAMGKKAVMVGKDVGKKLDDRIEAVAERLGDGATHKAVRDSLLDALASDIEDRRNRGQDTDDLNDEAEVIALLFGMRDSLEAVRKVLSRLETEGKLDGKVAFMTAHRAKGLEASRVWMLADTFTCRGQEERNLWYVAVTRAKHALFLAGGSNGAV